MSLLLKRVISSRSPALSLITRPLIFRQTILIQTPKYLLSTSPISKIEKDFSRLLAREIKQESETHIAAEPPRGFTVSGREAAKTTISRNFPDGSIVCVEINLAGAVQPDLSNEDDSESQVASDLDIRPEMSIRITKPSGTAIIFHCSLPVKDGSETEPTDSKTDSFVVDSIEMEKIPGYFVYADLFDDDMYDHLMHLLSDRGLNDQFQQELREFCSAEEHLLYRKFLSELKTFCDE